MIEEAVLAEYKKIIGKKKESKLMWLVFSLVIGVVVVAVLFFFMAIVSIIGKWVLSIEFAFALVLIFSASVAVNGRMKRYQHR